MFLLATLLLVPLLINAQIQDERRGITRVGVDAPAQNRDFAAPRVGNRLRVAVLTSAYQPFSRIKSSCEGVDPFTGSEECQANNRFEGFCIDLLDSIRNELPGRFNYEIVPSFDDVYGTRMANGSYNGIIGSLQRREVDLACTPLVANEERQRILDFSQPLMQTSIGILMRQRSDDSCFSFLLRPFTCWTWMFILLRRSPQGHQRQFEHRDNGRESEIGSDAGGHMELNPKVDLVKNIRRLLKYLIWTFALLFLVFYFANMIAYLVARRAQDSAIRDIDDLLSQPNLRFGMVRNGNTHQFLQQSTNPTHQQLFQRLESQSPSGFVANYSEGVQRIRDSDENFAFLLETSAMDYARRQDCSFFRTGINLNSIFNYAIAMPLGSPWKNTINGALQTLQSRGELETLRNRWWMEAGEACNEEERFALGWSDLCGLFLLLPLIFLFGLLYFLAQHFLRNRRGHQGRRPYGGLGRQDLGRHGETSKERLHNPDIVVRSQETVTTDRGHSNENFEHQRPTNGARIIDHPIHRSDERGQL
ncbi:ligated ion channel l-glutamate- and glycine-binding site domain-containing protein [Ditylenchus destructor]|uniref:Ligated ion channel l-glutamate- and glycine-binding site domain-containing protein n=1 Tax=Ditylenchus destructor TaxID=166010 RepID=A0AAD4R267_9BILA|nr:ligated ion channel l-glutamate- and glycine-binding site domain-containing protein [Ditylenchus destructor]